MRTALRSASVATAVMALVLSAGPAAAGSAGETGAAAAEDVDARWLPWLGCWELREEGAPRTAPSGRPIADLLRSLTPRSASVAEGIRVCLLPAGPADTLVMRTLAGGAVVLEETITADGLRHDVDEPACEGWRERTWSVDGRRLFTRAELACDGQARRRVSGITLIAPDGAWVDVQAVEIEEREHVRVRRYARADDQVAASVTPAVAARTAAGRSAATVFGVEEVVEAQGRVSGPALEAALVEMAARLHLDSRTLVRLDDAGVESGVIDLLVALSFPDRFIVDRTDTRGSLASGPVAGFPGLFDPLRDPYGIDPFWYPYYAAPFGYAYGWSRYDPFFGPLRGRRVVVLPSGDEPSPGRAIEGRGYTRVRARDEAAAGGTVAPRESEERAGRRGRSGSGDGATGATASPRGYSGGGGSTAGSGSRSGSGGESGSGSGRTATPRNPDR